MPNKIVNRIDSVKIFPANMFSTQKEVLNKAMDKIRIDLGKLSNNSFDNFKSSSNFFLSNNDINSFILISEGSKELI